MTKSFQDFFTETPNGYLRTSSPAAVQFHPSTSERKDIESFQEVALGVIEAAEAAGYRVHTHETSRFDAGYDLVTVYLK